MLFIAISVKEEGKFAELAKQVEATKEVMAMNIEKLLDRREALDTLEDKAEELQWTSSRFSLAKPRTQSAAGSVWQKPPDTSPVPASLQTLAATSPSYSPTSPAYSPASSAYTPSFPVSSSSYSLLATAREKQMIQHLGEADSELKSLFSGLSFLVHDQEEQLDQVSLEEDVRKSSSLILEDMLSDVTVATIAGPTKRKSSKSKMPPPPPKAPLPPPPPPEVMRPMAKASLLPGAPPPPPIQSKLRSKTVEMHSVKEKRKLAEKQVEATKEVMAMKIEKILDRGEALDMLQDNSRFSLAKPRTLAATSLSYSPTSPAYSPSLLPGAPPPPPPQSKLRSKTVQLSGLRMSAAVGRGAGAPHPPPPPPPMAPVPAQAVSIPPPPTSGRSLHINAFQGPQQQHRMRQFSAAPPMPPKIPAGGLFGQAVNKSGAPPLPPKAAGFAGGVIRFGAVRAPSSSTSSMLPPPPAPPPPPPPSPPSPGVMFKHAAPAPVPLGRKLGGKGYADTDKKPAPRESLLSSIRGGAALKKTPAPEVVCKIYFVLYFS